MEWYQLFKSYILDRGIEYCENGYVTEFSYEDGVISAVVDGTEEYHIDIELDGEDVMEMSCDCPHARAGNNCKHNNIVDIREKTEFTCQILKEEHRYAELMDLIEQKNDIFLLERYEKPLKKEVPDRVIALYKEYLIQMADIASDRKKYRHLMPYLKKIASCKNGKAIANQIAEEWHEKYKRRTAMMDELRTAGY